MKRPWLTDRQIQVPIRSTSQKKDTNVAVVAIDQCGLSLPLLVQLLFLPPQFSLLLLLVDHHQSVTVRYPPPSFSPFHH